MDHFLNYACHLAWEPNVLCIVPIISSVQEGTIDEEGIGSLPKGHQRNHAKKKISGVF